MPRFSALLCAVFLLASGLLEAEAEEGFTSLFNGEDLRGWVLVHKTKNSKGYLVEDSKIVCPSDGGGNLLTMREFANFRLRFEYRMEPGGNNGIAIRAPVSGDIAYTGMEVQILDHAHEKYAGWLKPWQRHGAIYNIQPPHADALLPAGEWNEQEILAIGSTIVVTLNGTEITRAGLGAVTDPETIEKHPGMFRKKGRIGFLGHGSRVEFRNIRIQELPDLENPQVCELAIEESCSVWAANGKTRRVTLRGFSEHTEPYYVEEASQFVDAVVSAEASVSVDGRIGRVAGGPYRLPAVINGVSILLSNTSNWQGGTHEDQLRAGKSVRLELQDASLPFYAPDRFAFPIDNYRWRAGNALHTFLGLVVDQPRLYYHRGEDMGHFPDKDAVFSMTGGRVTAFPGPRGDQRSNGIVIEDETGLTIRYAHMNSLYLRTDRPPGSEVRRGEKLGLTGSTWMGRPGMRDPHLHLDVSAGETRRNSYPVLVAAYQHTYPGETLPVAGGVRHVWAGDEVELDGSLSIPARGRKIVNYRWSLAGGVFADGPKATRRYERPGAYSETLRVIDNKGATSYDFVEVYVLDRGVKRRPPYARINYWPVRGVTAGTAVKFDIRAERMRNVTVDFGDGTVEAWRQAHSHAFARPGTYFVTVRGEDDGSGPGMFRVRVVVED